MVCYLFALMNRINGSGWICLFEFYLMKLAYDMFKSCFQLMGLFGLACLSLSTGICTCEIVLDFRVFRKTAYDMFISCFQRIFISLP